MNITHPCDQWARGAGHSCWADAVAKMKEGVVLIGPLPLGGKGKTMFGISLFLEQVRKEGLHIHVFPDSFLGMVGMRDHFDQKLIGPAPAGHVYQREPALSPEQPRSEFKTLDPDIAKFISDNLWDLAAPSAQASPRRSVDESEWHKLVAEVGRPLPELRSELVAAVKAGDLRVPVLAELHEKLGGWDAPEVSGEVKAEPQKPNYRAECWPESPHNKQAEPSDNWHQYAAESEGTAQNVIERHRAELGRAYRCIQGMHYALAAAPPMVNEAYHAVTIAAAKRFVFEGAMDGSDYFVGKPAGVLHAALALPAQAEQKAGE